MQTNDAGCWPLYRELAERDELPLRVFLTIGHGDMGGPEAPPSAGTALGLLSCDRVKIFSDGSLGAETAALRRPYVGSSNTGMLVWSAAELEAMVSAAKAQGYRLEIHAIGDRAAEAVLDALAAAKVGAEDRPVLTHCQVLGPDLIQRMAAGGVIANIQPSFVLTDAAWCSKRLEPAVQEFAYAWKTVGPTLRDECCLGVV